MTAGFGGAGYQSQDDRVTSSITKTPNPDAVDLSKADKVAEIVQRQNYQIKALATQVKGLQKGVNDATQNPLQQLQQFVADIIVLFGGGELVDGALDFGDLQYILPALGALFGLGDAPFPIDLLQAAEKFFLGYVVPNKQFVDEINKIIGGWMTAFGIDPKFVKDTQKLITALGELVDEIGNFVPATLEFLVNLALPTVKGFSDLPILGALLGPIVKLFAGIDLAKFGTAIEFITDAVDPFIVQLTSVINFIDAVLHVMGAVEQGISVVNDPLPQLIVPFQNLVKFLGDIRFAVTHFDPVGQVQSWIGRLLLPISGWSDVQPNLQIDPGFDDSSSLAEGSSAWQPQNLDPPVTNNDWAWDLIGRTAGGSATVVANGVEHGLLGTVMSVTEGQTFVVEAWAQWLGLTASSGAIALQVHTDGGINTTIASIPSPGATGSWTHLSGGYTVPAGVSTIRIRLMVGSGASLGQVWFDDTNIRRTNLVHQGLIQNLEDDLSQVAAWILGIINQILTAFGLPTTGDINAGTASILTALQNIPNTAVQGIEGLGADIGASVNAFVNAFLAPWSALVGGFSGHAGVSTGAASILSTLDSAGSVAASAATNVAHLAISKPSYIGVDPSADVVFDLSILGASPTFVNATQAAAVVGFIGISHGGGLGAGADLGPLKESVAWFGKTGSGSMSGIHGMFVNIYRVDRSNGHQTLVHQSNNILLTQSVSGVLSWNYYNLPVGLQTAQGECYAVELEVLGTDTYQVVGTPGHWLSTIGNNPNVFPPQMGGTRATGVKTVGFDAVGSFGNKHAQTTTTTSVTWNDSSVAGNTVYACVAVGGLGSSATPTVTATYDPSGANLPMTLVGSGPIYAAGYGLVAVLELRNAPGGTKQVTASATASGAVPSIAGNSVSYANTGYTAAVVTNSGNSNTVTVGATGVAGGRVLCVIGENTGGNTQTLGSFSGSQRYLSNVGSGTDVLLHIGDSATVGPFNFTASQVNSSSNTWGAITVVLTPALSDPPSPITAPTYSGDVPWFALCGAAGRSENIPVTTLFSTPGSGQTYTLPSWVQVGDYVDIVLLGGGSGAILSTPASPGPGGIWVGAKLVYGTDIPLTTKTFTITVGAGGPNLAQPGSASSAVISGYGALSAGGGDHGYTGPPSGTSITPGNYTLDGLTYYGGASPGAAPGAGGNPAGAPGAVWITAYQQ